MSEREDLTTDDVIARLQALHDEAWDPPQAPPLRIDLGLDGAVARPVPERGPRRRRMPAWVWAPVTLRPLTALAMTSVLLVVGLGGGLLLAADEDGGPVTPAGERVELAGLPGAPGARATAIVSGGSGVELHVDGLARSRPGEYYELWALNTPTNLAPIGTFRVGVDGTADVRFALGIDPRDYKALDVSVEREDGDPAHSGDSLLRAAIPA